MIMTRREIAINYFKEGYNCSQAVLLAFQDVVGLTKEQCAKLASSFGGGMGKLREVCGAVSGMFMVAGLLDGYSDPKDADAKAKHYQNIQHLASLFTEQNGSIICRELLSGNFCKHSDVKQSGVSAEEISSSTPPAKRTDEYYKKRPCADLVGDAAEILAAYLNL